MTVEPPADDQDVDALQHEVEVLEEENEALRSKVETTPAPKKRRGRTIASWVLIVLACFLAILSVVVVYARDELLNTDTFVATVAPLAKDHAIQIAVATKVSDNLVARTDIEQRVKNALPPKAGFLANPISGAVHTATYQVTLQLVQSSRFQTLWEQALRQSHEQLDNLLLGQKVGALQATNGEVTVDLSQVEDTAKKALAARGLSVFNKIPNYTGAPFVLFQSDQLAKLQRWIRFLNHLALVLPIVSVLLLAGAVLLARDRRRGVVHAASGLAVSMALLLVAANVGRNQYLSSLKASQPKDATAAIIDTVDAALLDTVRTVLIIAAVVAIIAFVVGLGPVQEMEPEAHHASLAVDRSRPRHGRRPPQGVPVARARARSGGPGPLESTDRRGGADHCPRHLVRGDAGRPLRRASVVRETASGVSDGPGPDPGLPVGSIAG